MEFNFENFGLRFGRKPKQPVRETSLAYYGTGTTKTIYSTISKEVTADCLRKFANHPICRRAISIVKNGLLNCEWIVEKKNLADSANYDEVIKTINRCIEQPNYSDSFRSLYGAIIEDILTGDCGCIEIVQGADPNKPLWLYPVDGFTIQVRTEFITSPKDIKYLQRSADGREIKLADEDIMYHRLNDFTHTPMGVSPVETAFTLINYLINSQKYAGIVTSNAVPKYILNLGENLDEQTLVRFRKYFDEEVYGSGKTPLVGGSKGIKAEKISADSDDGLYLQWQHFLIAIIAFSFGVDPKRLNEGSQTDRSTVDEQRENVFDEAIKPLAKVLEENINKKVIGRLGYNEQLIFRFVFEDNETRKKQKSDRILNEYNSDLLMLDEAREMLGYSKIKGKFGKMLKSEIKNELNIEYAEKTQVDNGGYNGVGKNRYGGEKTE